MHRALNPSDSGEQAVFKKGERGVIHMAQFDGMERIIQESVPGKQITIAHIIASPVPELYERLGIDEKGAIGILTLTPYETAIIAADIAAKAADVEIGFLDRFTGSVVISGDVASVENALISIKDTFTELLGFTCAEITRT